MSGIHEDISESCTLPSVTETSFKSDTFWTAQRGRPFPMVASAVEESLNDYKEKEKRIKDLKVGVRS